MNEEFPHLQVGGAVETPQALWTEGPLDLTWESELPKDYIQDLPVGCDPTLPSPWLTPQHHSGLKLPLLSVVAFLSLGCPHFIFSGAKVRPATLSLTHRELQVPS